MIALITGAAGLIGSAAAQFFHDKGFEIIGIDNDMRKYFFGAEASTNESNLALSKKLPNYFNYGLDIRNYEQLESIISSYKDKIKIVIHCAAQPSHDWAAKEPLTDFSVNATGTLNMLELTRLYAPNATFIFTSTNKVYGDRPNYAFDMAEFEKRYECYKNNVAVEVDETMSIDNCKHSVFGASKVAADIMCQEYGKYFNMNVGIFRGGCLTGPNHSGTELHGFLSYLVKCAVYDKEYTIFGTGKQVRDNIHSYDLVNMFWHFHQNPRPGEVYNAGGGRENSISILEAIEYINTLDENVKWNKYTINPDKWRIGDHMWYISNLNKFKTHYPDWPGITIGVKEIIQEIFVKYQNQKESHEQL